MYKAYRAKNKRKGGIGMLYDHNRPQAEADRMLAASQGKCEADLVLKNGMVLNVFTGEFLKQDVAICGEAIVGVGQGYTGLTEEDLEGRYLVPGFIDAHVHIESSMLTPAAFAGAVLPRGTTTAIADPHEIANVCGARGIEYMLSEAEKSRMNLFVMLPSCVPATSFDSGGAVLEAADLLPYRNHPRVLGLGELMNVPGVVGGDRGVHEKLRAFADRRIDGHAPFIGGRQLAGCRLAGIDTDHECSSGEEALEKLRAGFAVLVREGSGARNLEALLRLVLERKLPCARLCFCTDDKHIDDILREGHIDHNIRRAIALGIDPVEAYRMAGWYPAQIYGLRRLGAIAAGYQADIVVLDSLLDVTVGAVLCKGIPVLPDDHAVYPAGDCAALEGTVHTGPLPESLPLSLGKGPVPVVEFLPRQINTLLTYEQLGEGGFIPSGPYRKAAVIERHRASGSIGVGIVKGLPVRGALASTVAHDSHNLVVIGDNDADMLLAARELARCDGGYIAVRDGRVRGLLPLPIGGLMSGLSASGAAKKLAELKLALQEMGIPKDCDPFHLLSFLPLPVLPAGRITDRGVFDSLQMRYINLC